MSVNCGPPGGECVRVWGINQSINQSIRFIQRNGLHNRPQASRGVGGECELWGGRMVSVYVCVWGRW